MENKFDYENPDIRKAFGYLMAPLFDCADIKISCAKKKGRTLFQMECRLDVLKSLEIQGEFAEIPEPTTFFRTRGGTVENAAFIDIKPSGVKKVLLELDIATGKAVLKAE